MKSRTLVLILTTLVAMLAISAGSAFALPSDISGLTVWLDASDPNAGGSIPANGAAISTWKNKAGGSVGDFTNASSSGQFPTYIASSSSFSNQPAVHFSTASGYQALANSTNFASPLTILYVGRLSGGANSRLLSSTSNNWLLGYWNGNKDMAYFEGWVSPAGGIATDTREHLYSATIAGSGSNSTVYRDGTTLYANQGGVTGPNGLRLGGGYLSGGTEFSNGDIAELVMYNRVLTPSELNSVGNYLQEKYSITGPATWIGGTTSNDSGSWEATSPRIPWSDGVKPVAADTATLGNVTSGTRTVTLDGVETITGLNMVQNTVGAVNKLSLNSNLTLTGTAPLSVTLGAGVGVGGTVIDLNAKTLTLNQDATVKGTMNLGTGGQLLSTSGSVGTQLGVVGQMNANGDSTVTLNNVYSAQLHALAIKSGGGLSVAAGKTFTVNAIGQGGGKLDLQSGSTITMGSGANIAVTTNDSSSYYNDAYFNNATTFSHDGYLNVQVQGTNSVWTTTAHATNSGNWTIASSGPNIGSFNMKAPSAQPQASSNLDNSGTLTFQANTQMNNQTVLPGSGSGNLNNSGTVNLYDGVSINNIYQYNQTAGATNVLGNAAIHINAGGYNAYNYHNFTIGSGSSLSVADGKTLSVEGAGGQYNTAITLASGSTVTMGSGANIAVSTLGPFAVSFSNGTTFSHTGNVNLTGVSSGYPQFNGVYVTNTGNWTVGGSLNMVSGGYGNSTSITNSGTMTFAAGAKLNDTSVSGMASAWTSDINNTGILNLNQGASLNRLYNVTDQNGGLIHVLGDVTLNATAGAGGSHTLTTQSGSTLTIDAGKTLTVNAIGNPSLTLASGSTVNMGAGANLTYNHVLATGETVPNATSFANATTLVHTGTVTINGPTSYYGNTLITNSGTWIDNGAVNISGWIGWDGTYSTFTNSGTLGGSGNLTFNASATGSLYMTNSGTIAPGNSPGALSLVNTNLTFASGGSLAMELGGVTAGTFDLLALSGRGGVLNLSTLGDVLNVSLVTGYIPTSNVWTIVTANSIVGTFDQVSLPTGFFLTYTPTAIRVTYVAAGPEPASLAMVALGGLLLLRRRRGV